MREKRWVPVSERHNGEPQIQIVINSDELDRAGQGEKCAQCCSSVKRFRDKWEKISSNTGRRGKVKWCVLVYLPWAYIACSWRGCHFHFERKYAINASVLPCFSTSLSTRESLKSVLTTSSSKRSALTMNMAFRCHSLKLTEQSSSLVLTAIYPSNNYWMAWHEIWCRYSCPSWDEL